MRVNCGLLMLLRVSSAVSLLPMARRVGVGVKSLPAIARRSKVTASAAASATKPPALITTPIYYVNGQPHIGHVYTTLASDVVARFMRLDGHEVKFLTGTDEHGQKVEQSAGLAGETPIEFADRVSETFRAILPLYNFSCDEFIRTTEPRHIAATQSLWRKLLDSGDIYLGAYEGWYSIRDEAFYTEDEIVDGLAPTGAPVEWVAEPSYFFALSKFHEPLVAHIEAHPEFIRPASRRNEVLAFMKDGLRDLSISRTTFGWGIPVPDQKEGDDLNHVMYVWLDALTNYITACGYPDVDNDEFGKWWPASLHMVGKDILRFHAIYWPAFLLAAGLPLPQRLFAHGWWTRDGQKMSKSIGNVVDPVALVHKYGVDQVRYYLMDAVSFGGDGDFSDDVLVSTVNSKLANELGNLLYRTLSFAYKHCDRAVPTPQQPLLEADEALLAAAAGLLPQLRGIVGELTLHRYSQTVSQVVQLGNQYIDVQAPWALRKTDPERMATVLWVLLEALRHVGVASQPVVPGLASEMLDQLGVEHAERSFECVAPGHRHALTPGALLPTPRIVIPRYEPPEEPEPPPPPPPPPPPAAAATASEGAAAVELSPEEVAAAVTAQGKEVKRLKAEGLGNKDPQVAAAVAELLRLKALLPEPAA